MAYDNGNTVVYRFPAITVSSAAVLGRIIGPKGKAGRLVSVSGVVTTALLGTTGQLEIGISGDSDKYGELSLPATLVNLGLNTDTITDTDTYQLPEDTIIDVSSTADLTSGAIDALVEIAWF